jgi:cytoskeletal protein RodZ
MNDFGGKLRQARERRGVSLRQIAAKTKISMAVLEALEHNDMSRLPGGIFSRAFVRSYAAEVGLDPDQAVREFLEQFHGKPARVAPGEAPVAEEEGAFDSQQRMAGVVLRLVLFSVPIAAAILYFTLRSQPSSNETMETPPVEPAAAPAVPATTPGSPAAAPAVPAAQVPAFATKSAAVPQPLLLELHPTGACWVELTVDGQRQFGRVMQGGETERREIRDSAVIQVGDAGAFAFSIDGHPGRPLGAAGEVKTVRITKDTVAQYLQ